MTQQHATAAQPGRRLAPAQRRREIIAGTVAALAAHGPQKCSLRQVARDMGIAPSLLTYFFNSWAELLQETYRWLAEMTEKSAFFYRDFEQYVEKDAAKHLKPDAAPVLQALIDGFAGLGDWSAEPLHAVVTAVGEQLGVKLGAVAQPIRVACCGMAVSPPIDLTLALLGRDRTLARLQRALDWIAAQ